MTVSANIRGMEITNDDLWPRVPEYRYRLVAVSGQDEMSVLAAAPDAGGLGEAIVQLHEDARETNPDARMYDAGRIGVLDVMPDGEVSPTGEWVILPWPKGGPA